jgi:hypothetical protein
MCDDWRDVPGFLADYSSNVMDAALSVARISLEIADAF